MPHEENPLFSRGSTPRSLRQEVLDTLAPAANGVKDDAAAVAEGRSEESPTEAVAREAPVVDAVTKLVTETAADGPRSLTKPPEFPSSNSEPMPEVPGDLELPRTPRAKAASILRRAAAEKKHQTELTANADADTAEDPRVLHPGGKVVPERNAIGLVTVAGSTTVVEKEMITKRSNTWTTKAAK